MKPEWLLLPAIGSKATLILRIEDIESCYAHNPETGPTKIFFRQRPPVFRPPFITELSLFDLADDLMGWVPTNPGDLSSGLKIGGDSSQLDPDRPYFSDDDDDDDEDDDDGDVPAK